MIKDSISEHENGVSLLIVNYNGSKYLKLLFKSINISFVDYKYPFEIVVYDNNSQDDSIDLLSQSKKKYNNLNYFIGEENLGFAKANNILAKNAIYSNLVLLNVDTRIIEFTNVIDYLNKNGALNKEIISCSLINEDHSRQANIFSFPGKLRIVLELFLLKQLIISLFLKKKKEIVDLNKYYFSGCFFVISKDLFIKVNGFDEDFFFYHEESDLFLRLQKLGVNKIYFREDKILHFGGGGILKDNSYINYYVSLYKLFVKHQFPNARFLLNLIFYLGFKYRILLCKLGFTINYSPFLSVYKHNADKKSPEEIMCLQKKTLKAIQAVMH